MGNIKVQIKFINIRTSNNVNLWNIDKVLLSLSKCWMKLFDALHTSNYDTFKMRIEEKIFSHNHFIQSLSYVARLRSW